MQKMISYASVKLCMYDNLLYMYINFYNLQLFFLVISELLCILFSGP